MKVSKNAIYKGMQELRTEIGPGEGRIRHPGGGRKLLLSRHSEWIDALRLVIEYIQQDFLRMRMSFGFPCRFLK